MERGWTRRCLSLLSLSLLPARLTRAHARSKTALLWHSHCARGRATARQQSGAAAPAPPRRPPRTAPPVRRAAGLHHGQAAFLVGQGQEAAVQYL